MKHKCGSFTDSGKNLEQEETTPGGTIGRKERPASVLKLHWVSETTEEQAAKTQTQQQKKIRGWENRVLRSIPYKQKTTQGITGSSGAWVIPALGRLRQEDHESEASLGYLAITCHKQRSNKYPWVTMQSLTPLPVPG